MRSGVYIFYRLRPWLSYRCLYLNIIQESFPFIYKIKYYFIQRCHLPFIIMSFQYQNFKEAWYLITIINLFLTLNLFFAYERSLIFLIWSHDVFLLLFSPDQTTLLNRPPITRVRTIIDCLIIINN